MNLRWLIDPHSKERRLQLGVWEPMTFPVEGGTGIDGYKEVWYDVPNVVASSSDIGESR